MMRENGKSRSVSKKLMFKIFVYKNYCYRFARAGRLRKRQEYAGYCLKYVIIIYYCVLPGI
jgi:hypothetical protein